MTSQIEPSPRPAPSSAPVWEDFADIFFEPSSVFARRRNGGFALVFIVLTIVIAALSWAWTNAMEPVFVQQFQGALAEMRARQPGLTEEQLATARRFMLISTKIGAIVMVPLVVLLTGFGIWMLGKLLDADLPFRTSLMIATFAQFPRVLKTAVEAVQATLLDPSSLTSLYSHSLSPARFLDPDEAGQTLLAVASRFDVFIIWMTVLIGIGVYVAGRTSKRTAIIIAGLLWLLGGLFAVGSAMRSPA